MSVTRTVRNVVSTSISAAWSPRRGALAVAVSVVAIGLLPVLKPAPSRAGEVLGSSDRIFDVWGEGRTFVSRVRSDPLNAMESVTRPDVAGADCSDFLMSPQLTLLEAATSAVCRNPQARVALTLVKERGAALGVAQSAWLPTIVVSGSGNDSNRRSTTTGNNATTTRTANSGNNGSVVLNQVLYDFGLRAAFEEKARFDLIGGIASQSVATQQLLFTAVQAYVVAQAKRAALEAWNDSAVSAEETLRAAQAKRSHGTGNVAEVLQAKAALSRVHLSRSRARTEAENAILNLNVAIGIDFDTDTHLPVFSASSFEPTTPLTLKALLADFQAHHPALIAANAQVESRRALVDSAKAAGMPSLAFNASFYVNGRPGNVQSETRSNEQHVDLTLTVPLFEGFARTYKVAQAQAQLEGELAKQEVVLANIQHDVAKSYEGLRSQAMSLGASSDLLAATEESFRASKARFLGGVSDILELLEAQKDLTNAKQERVQALVDWRIASWKLSTSLGQLNLNLLQSQLQKR